MGKRKDRKTVFIHQLKTLENLEAKVTKLINNHGRLRNSHLGVVFRTVIDPNEPTIYEDGHHGRG